MKYTKITEAIKLESKLRALRAFVVKHSVIRQFRSTRNDMKPGQKVVEEALAQAG